MICGAVLVVVILSLLKRRRDVTRKLAQLRNDWGKIPANAMDIESARILFECNIPDSPDHSYTVDKDTWADLDFDDIYALINRTTTPTGAQYLFHLLKHPTVEKGVLEDRERLIDRFSVDQDLREQVQRAIRGLGDMNAKYLPYLLWKSLPDRPSYAKYLPVLSAGSILALLLVVFGFLHFTILIGVFLVNLAIRFYVKRRIDIFLYSFQYLGILIGAARKLSSLKDDEIASVRSTLKSNLEGTRIIEKIVLALQFEDSLGVMEYLNIYFLWDVSGFYSAINRIKRHVEELRNLYNMVGYLDAMIAVASFRMDHDTFCRPSFTADAKRYRVNGAYNPLLRDPVPNSFEFDTPDYIVTGSNMAGKTTFIKTMAVNAILSQTINTCMAKKYEGPLVRVISSMVREDNLLLGKSYFMAEVESILRLIRASESDVTHLFLLDEIFRGTNSVERHAVSIEVLSYLANKKDFVLVATHDLKLSETLSDEYQNIHFQEEVGEEGLAFDYKLHPGSSTTRNAIALLKHVGYPASITRNATNRVNDAGT